jgi:alpha-D-ribose 1-methylphosphonate 5-triphosphate synthase subunit PhnH
VDGASAPHGLAPAPALLLLALCDEATAVWWQPGMEVETLSTWLRFHTGAPCCMQPGAAAFAVIGAPPAMPPLDAFGIGTAAAPEFSATLLIQVPGFDEGPEVQWRGPGIQDCERVRIAGLRESFWAEWQANHASFPQGVDVLFCCGDRVLGLPRTTRVRRLERT